MTMSDFDTRRVGEINDLEQQLKHARDAAAGYKLIADRWQPRFTSEIANDTAKISLTFGGKTMTATYPIAALAGADLTSATSSVLQTLFDALIADALRPVTQPEVSRMLDAANSLKQVGKW
jgi:hypothetical protein